VIQISDFWSTLRNHSTWYLVWEPLSSHSPLTSIDWGETGIKKPFYFRTKHVYHSTPETVFPRLHAITAISCHWKGQNIFSSQCSTAMKMSVVSGYLISITLIPESNQQTCPTPKDLSNQNYFFFRCVCGGEILNTGPLAC
jgi:hypothetical protein